MGELTVGKSSLFDLFVMLVPGAIVTASVTWLTAFPYDNSSPDLVVFLAVSFGVGLLLRPLVLLIRDELDKFLYGGRAKDVFLKGGRIIPVIGDRFTRVLAKRCVDVALRRCNIKSLEPEFAFDYMVSCLDVWGRSSKSDRLHELANTCMALAVASLTSALVMLSLPVVSTPTSWQSGGIAALVLSVVCVPLFASSAVRYERTRFSTVIRTFAAGLEDNSTSAYHD